jgi:hypothetical protein
MHSGREKHLSYSEPYNPDQYTLTRKGQVLVWTNVVQPGEQAYIWRGSALTTGETSTGGEPKPGSPKLVLLNLFHDGIAAWNMCIGIGPVGAAAFPGLNLPLYPIPAGPAAYPPGNTSHPLSLWDELIVQHSSLVAQTLQCCLVVVEP